MENVRATLSEGRVIQVECKKKNETTDMQRDSKTKM